MTGQKKPMCVFVLNVDINRKFILVLFIHLDKIECSQNRMCHTHTIIAHRKQCSDIMLYWVG